MTVTSHSASPSSAISALVSWDRGEVNEERSGKGRVPVRAAGGEGLLAQGFAGGKSRLALVGKCVLILPILTSNKTLQLRHIILHLPTFHGFSS